MSSPSQKDTQKSRLKELINRGKEQGYLTYAEVNDHLPADVTDAEQVEDLIGMISDMGIAVSEEAAPTEELLLDNANATTDDETTTEEAASVLANNIEQGELGRTIDPVRLYMREMGRIELLSREGEIAIAKRIEEGIIQMLTTLANQPQMIAEVLADFDRVEKGELRLSDLISGYMEPDLEGEEEDTNQSKPATVDSEDESDESGGDLFDDEEAGLDPVKAKERFEELRKYYQETIATEKRLGQAHKR